MPGLALLRIAPPRKDPQIRPVIADDVDVVRKPAGAEVPVPGAVEEVRVIVLDHDVVRRLRIAGAAVLSVHIGPVVAKDRHPHGRRLDVEDQQTVGEIHPLTVAQETGKRNALAIR